MIKDKNDAKIERHKYKSELRFLSYENRLSL